MSTWWKRFFPFRGEPVYVLGLTFRSSSPFLWLNWWSEHFAELIQAIWGRSTQGKEQRKCAVSCIPAGSASKMSLLSLCLLLVKNQKYVRNGHLTGALKWFLSKAATLIEAVWNKQQLRYVIREPKAALCDHRAKGLRPLGTRSLPHPIMPLSTKHCTSSTINTPQILWAGLSLNL